MEEMVGPVSTCGRELFRGWLRPIGFVVSFMIFTASVRNILDSRPLILWQFALLAFIFRHVTHRLRYSKISSTHYLQILSSRNILIMEAVCPSKPSKYPSFAFDGKWIVWHFCSQLIRNYFHVNRIENSCHFLCRPKQKSGYTKITVCNIMCICAPWFLIWSKERTWKILISWAEENIWM
jgi:hypothetical protein